MAENKYVVFKLAEESYGFPIEAVERILPEQKVTPVPRTPKLFLGLFDLRGTTVPTIDLRRRFDFPDNTETANFIVVQSEGGRCAVRVDSVDGILNFEDGQIEENPALFKRSADDDFVSGVGKIGERLVVLVDPDHLLPAKLRKQLGTLELAKAA